MLSAEMDIAEALAKGTGNLMSNDEEARALANTIVEHVRKACVGKATSIVIAGLAVALAEAAMNIHINAERGVASARQAFMEQNPGVEDVQMQAISHDAAMLAISCYAHRVLVAYSMDKQNTGSDARELKEYLASGGKLS